MPQIDEVFPPRGVIRSRTAGRQIVDFRDLRWGNITPTDLDCCIRVACSIDRRGQVFAIVEYKQRGAPLPLGQAMHLLALVSNSSAPMIAVIADHSHPSDEDIDGAAAMVRCFRSNPPDLFDADGPGEWATPFVPMSVKECLDEFFSRHGFPRGDGR
jgi:hypothetical protein